MFGAIFPKNPYIGQIFYHAGLQKTFEYTERDRLAMMINCHTDYCEWKDITEELD